MNEEMRYVELSLKVGCKNACKYCPQDVYLKAYKGDTKEMSLDDFKRMLKNIPNKYALQIAGKAEPFLNKDFPDMLIYASEQGYKINLFTTLVGFNEEIAKKLNAAKVKIDHTILHIFNSPSFKPIEFAKNKSLFLRNVCSVFTNTTVVSNPVSIAGNLFKIEPQTGTMKSICSRAYNNSIDVDGSIYFCCMDWALKYKLGNIYEHAIDSEEINFKRMEFIEKMKSDDMNFICRHCEWFDESKRP
jgi:radical SAM protein with 4Fe4S-binding SPASM domain